MIRKKTATYALLSLYEIAAQQRGATTPVGVRAGDISQKYRLPKAYAAKILSQLANAGVLHSDRGPHGGFRLNRSVSEISIYDVFECVGAIIGNRTKATNIKGLPPPVQGALNRAYQDTAEALKEVFSRTTLADIIGKEATT